MEVYDVIIIGSGVAGLSAGMYAGRFQLKTVVIGAQPGGIITTTDLVENYPGIKSIGGADMGLVFYEHAQQFGAIMKNETVTEVRPCPCPPGHPEKVQCAYEVLTGSGAYIGKAVIFATGTEYRKIGVPGEKEFAAKGVSYCALCDGAFFKEKTVCVVGGGDSTAIDALILTGFCKKIYVLVRGDRMKAEPVNYEKMLKSPKIEIRYKTEVAEILGGKTIAGDGGSAASSERVTGIKLKSGETLQLDGVFVAIGHIPLSNLAKKLGAALDDHGYIKVNVGSETNLPGIYAAGDVTDKPFKQAIIGASEGVMAAYFAYQYLQKNQVMYFCE